MQLTGTFSDYFIVFGAGVLMSFTPCLYPVMPLTASIIAAVDERGTKVMGFLLSLIFVLGMATTYSALAVFAVLTGKIFGQVQNHPVVLTGVAFVMAFFALVMFDVIPFLHFGLKNHKHIKPKDVWSVFLFGMTSGLIVGPCMAPVLGTILLYVASRQNIVFGVSLLFVFAFGVGASLILIGTFSGILTNLPKSGRWLLRIKHFCGLVLAAGSLFFFFKAFNAFMGR